MSSNECAPLAADMSSVAPRKRVARLGAACALVLAASSLSACGSSSDATCDEFAHMSPDTGLFSSMNSEQSSALKTSLKAAGYDDSALNLALGWSEVIAYCNVYDGVANANNSQPISHAH